MQRIIARLSAATVFLMCLALYAHLGHSDVYRGHPIEHEDQP